MMQAENKTADSENSVVRQFLIFNFSGEDYAVDILRVQEIRGWEAVRHLPETPDYVKGVIDLRGLVVPIIDLRIRFGCPSPTYSTSTVVVVISVSNASEQAQLVGIVVDGVSDVLDIDQREIKPSPAIAGVMSQRCLHGIVTLDQGMVVIVDIDKLLSQQELHQLSGFSV